MNNALGYMRVSTANQVKDGYSLDEQLNEIEKFCTANGYNLIEVYRDGLIDMLNRIKTGDSQDLRVVMQTLLPRCGPAITGQNLPVIATDEILLDALLEDEPDPILRHILTLIADNQGTKNTI